HRKYDITASQIKDAYQGIVSNPRPFLVDAAYIYVYGTGRKGFEKVPRDIEVQPVELVQPSAAVPKPARPLRMGVIVMALAAAMLFFLYKWLSLKNEWESVKSDLVLLPHKPTAAEIDSLTGVWLCYTASPQARISNPNRYHLVVSNVVDVKYKNGYFVFQRF